MCFKSYRNRILCFWPRSQEIFWGPEFLKKEYLSKFFVAKMKKTLGYAFVSKK